MEGTITINNNPHFTKCETRGIFLMRITIILMLKRIKARIQRKKCFPNRHPYTFGNRESIFSMVVMPRQDRYVKFRAFQC